jgi:hypothetical protein
MWVVHKLSRDLPSGMRLILGLLVFLPDSIRIGLPAGLPQLTIHRILIVVAFIFLIKNRSPDRRRWPIPNIRLVLLFGLSQLVSLCIATQFVPGLKGVFSYAIEVVLFYVLITEYVQTESDIVRLLSSICYGLFAVAVVATIDKYLKIDLVEIFLPFRSSEWKEGITATYPHRILLGYAMVMGLPLSLALSTHIKEITQRRVMNGIAILLIGATYFSMSRGAWIGLGVGVVGLVLVGGRSMQKKLIIIAALAAALLILRPGVKETIRDSYLETVDEDTVKGGSYEYRWQLWGVAWKEIQVSTERLLFGFGPVSTESMDLTDYFRGREGYSSSMTILGYTSWDNNYASDLIELGVVGLTFEAILHFSIVWILINNWRKSDPKNRVLQGAIMIACLIFMLAMTNVFIFSPQLKYLFWTLVAVGSNFSRFHAIQHRQHEPEGGLSELQVAETELVGVSE